MFARANLLYRSRRPMTETPAISAKGRSDVWIVLAVLLVGIPTLWQPMGLDHGNCGYVADVILHGGAPYKDAWETRPPAIFYINAAAIAVFGKNAFAFRMFDLLWQLAAALALGALARRWFGARAGMFAGVLFAAVYFIPASYWDLANGDIYIVLPSALALLCLLPRRGPRLAWDAACGALVGFVFWVRFTHGLFGLPVLAWILAENLHERPYGLTNRALRLSAVGAGFAAVVGGYLALLAAQGALGDFLYTVFDFDMKYAQTTYRGGFPEFARFVIAKHVIWSWRNLAVVTPGALALIQLARTRPVTLTTIVLGAWTAATYAGVAIMAKFFVYHWFALLGPLSVLAGFALAEATAKPRAAWITTGHRIVMAVCVALLALAVAGQTLVRASEGFRLATGKMSRDEYLASFDNLRDFGTFSATANHLGGELLRERTSPDDKIWIWSASTLVLFNADRLGVGRFGTNLMLAPAWRRADWTDELLRLVQTERPAYAIVTFGDAGAPITGGELDSRQLLATFPELAAYWRENYELESTIGNMEFHRRRDLPPTVTTTPSSP